MLFYRVFFKCNHFSGNLVNNKINFVYIVEIANAESYNAVSMHFIKVEQFFKSTFVM